MSYYDYDEPYFSSQAERDLWRYEHDENFGCYDVGSHLDSHYQKLKQDVEDERRGYHK